MESFDDFMRTIIPGLKRISNIIEQQFFDGLNIYLIIPGIIHIKVRDLLIGLYILVIVSSILIMFVIGNIMGQGIYIPCFGCGKSSKVFKCIPGTGHGSSQCSAYKKTLGIWNGFIGSIGSIGGATDSLVHFIGRAISFIVNGVIWLFKKIMGLFLLPGKLLDSLASAIPYMSVSSSFEINLGESLLGCKSKSTDECLYVFKNGSNTYELRKHGNGKFLKEIFSIIKEFLKLYHFLM